MNPSFDPPNARSSPENPPFPGDDQDLDDRVIRHLWDENKELREEVNQLRKDTGDDADEGGKIFKHRFSSGIGDDFWKSFLDQMEIEIGPGASLSLNFCTTYRVTF